MHVLPLVHREDVAGLPELRRRARPASEASGDLVTDVRHLYVHLPFCAHRCGYCDFVTATGRDHLHGAYVDALLRELEEEHDGSPVETIFLGGGTPTFTALPELLRLLGALPPAGELTVEANPETVTRELARRLRADGVNRISLGAQTFQPHLLSVLERRASPADVERAFGRLRDAGFDNLSLDLIYGIPGQSPAQLAADLERAIALGPEHISAYELEAKPGTRFTIAHGAELERQAEQMEDYFERVVATVTGAGYRWYETANFCRDGKRVEHNLGYWLGQDYLGLGVGAVSTLGHERRRNTPKLARYLRGHYDREIEWLDDQTRARERVMLGLRLDEPLPLAGLRPALDAAGLARAERLGLAVDGGQTLTLTERGRFLGGAVTAEILA
jgi:oxygen-independent coproporphyrinogen-3 oxidase